MNEATWIATKKRSSQWSWWWSRRRRRTRPLDHGPDEEVYAVTLVGTFQDTSTLLRALQAFSAAAFTPQEIICIPASGQEPEGSVSSKLCGFLERVFGFPSWGEEILVMHAPLAVRECIRNVLESGGALVFVRPANRFHQACQLIHQAGGQVGLKRLQA